MKHPPNRIWRQYYGDSEEPIEDDDPAEVTWCEDRINNRDVCYVRENWLERLQKIERAATHLVDCKGRFHTEQAMKELVEAIKIPHF